MDDRPDPSPDIFTLIGAERRRAADLFDGLDEAQWSTTSLCSAWTVGDIAGHLIGPFCVSIPRFVVGGILSGSFHRYSERLSRRLGQRPRSQIVATLREHADDRWAPPGTGPLAPLTDLAVHTRDVARPLGLDTGAPLETWRGVLDFLTSARARRGFVPGGRLTGLRFESTDQPWAWGAGAPLSGPSEAVALALAGRRAALSDLTGDGVATLAGRLG